MDKEQDNSEGNTLIFKNIPKQIDDLAELLSSLKIPAKHIKPFGRKRALITYETKADAGVALEIIGRQEFAGKLLNISLFSKEKPKDKDVGGFKEGRKIPKCHKAVQTANERLPTCGANTQQVNKYVQKLYAIEGDLNFDQPPPPYLKYQYPPVSQEILANICLSLTSNKKFYTQVLHLMNRMNLEPPFSERREKYTLCPFKDAFTHTESVGAQQEFLRKQESESELESADEDNKTDKKLPEQMKRKLPPTEDQYKKKARRMLQTAQKLSKTATVSPSSISAIDSVFECSVKEVHSSKIEFKLKPPRVPNETFATTTPTHTSIAPNTTCAPPHADGQRISLNEMQELSVFKNYQQGEPSNKLYIKNLQKDVVTEDIHDLYKRFTQNYDIRMEVKVMQHGRMKGQAFISFTAGRLPAEELNKVVAHALESTNGLMFRQKPMVVCFGKQTQKDN